MEQDISRDEIDGFRTIRERLVDKIRIQKIELPQFPFEGGQIFERSKWKWRRRFQGDIRQMQLDS